MLISRGSFDNLIFDFGDTLATLTPPKERLCLEVLREMGYGHSEESVRRAYSVVEFFMHHRSSQLKDAGKRSQFYSGFNYQLSVCLQIERDHKKFDELMQRHFGDRRHWVVFPEAVEVLPVLYADYDLYILANWDASLTEICRRNNIDRYFKGAYCSEELGAEKPDKDIFASFIGRTGVKPERSAYIGNEYFADVVGSRNCGFSPILVDRGLNNDTDCDCVRIHGLRELIE